MSVDLSTLPSPFYRVTIKALIFDSADRLLVVRADGVYEMPGGGWEHGEDLDACLRREVQEEVGAEVLSVGNILHTYRGKSIKGFMTLRLLVSAAIANPDQYRFVASDDAEGAEFVTREVFEALTFAVDEQGIQELADEIWAHRLNTEGK